LSPTGTAVPPPPEDVSDNRTFDARQSVKPHDYLARTLIEPTPAGESATNQAGQATFNPVATAPMEDSPAPVKGTIAGDKAAPPTRKPERSQDTQGPEESLVIQPRDVRRQAGEIEQRWDYEVSEPIGEGGMGIVYQARQASLDREVALKMVKPREVDEAVRARYSVSELQRVEQVMQKRDRQWFLSEAVVTANLEHPFIVPIYDVIKDREDSLFYAMKWVRGTPWNKSIREKSTNENIEILLKVADAVAFAQWLSSKTGHQYRLPSASEWEYAARAGGETVYPWASNGSNACAFANVADASATRRYPGWVAFACDDGYANTSPVGSSKANPFGLNDMLGNVFQWTLDCWHADYGGAPVDGSARTDGDCSERELRGGSWFTSPSLVRANYRNHFAADYRTSSVGIRLVRDIAP
jgi:hypothetical protein